MGPGLAHLDKKIESRKRGCNEQYLAEDRRQLCVLSIRDRSQHVFDVDKADHIVECFSINGDPGVTLLDHTFDHLGKGRLDVERNDVDAGHHDIGCRPIVNFENISYQDSLLCAERMRVIYGGLLDHLIDCFSQALAIAWTPDFPQEAAYASKRPILLNLTAASGQLRIVHRRTDLDSIAKSMS